MNKFVVVNPGESAGDNEKNEGLVDHLELVEKLKSGMFNLNSFSGILKIKSLLGK